MKKITNPFIISGYEGDRYFCDRCSETQRLRDEISNGNNVALIATRRMGKSGLIHHFFQQPDIQADYYTFFIDIYDTKTLAELVMKLGREIVERLSPHGLTAVKKFWDCVRTLQAGITFSPSGEVSFTLQVGDIKQSNNTLDEIFKYLNSAEKPCIVAIDEFQQIANYPETNMEATLRTYIQQSHNAQFIFSGSQRHTMSQMFISAARPFFQSVSIMHLEAINQTKYDEFAKKHFADAGKQLADDVTENVYAFSNGITWYSQKIFNTLFAQTPVGTTCFGDSIPDTIHYIINTQEYSFKEMMFRLPEKQKSVLTALAKEGQAHAITSGNFIKKYSLSSASSVQAAVKGLLEKDFITHEDGTYRVYDLFLARWLQNN